MTQTRTLRTLALPLLAVLAFAGVLTAAVARDDDVRLDGSDRATVGDALPPGWDVRPVRGHEAPVTEVVDDPDLGPVLRFESASQAAFFGNELDTRLDPAGGTLEWRWRVDRTIRRADLRVPEADDALARVMVVFGDRGLFSRPDILFYTWGNTEPVGTDFPSRVGDNLHIIVLRNADDPTGEWVTERRDLLEDYRAAFGEDPEPVTGVGFMSDTENLPTEGTSFLGPVIWVPES